MPPKGEGCRQCACYTRGRQDAAWETYEINRAATALREQIETERQAVKRWHE